MQGYQSEIKSVDLFSLKGLVVPKDQEEGQSSSPDVVSGEKETDEVDDE